MRQILLIFLGLIPLLACTSTPEITYKNLAISEAELLKAKWQVLQRFAPLYPIEHARAGKEGSAIIEFVITPDYQVEAIKVVSTTGRFFAKQAKLNIKKWSWQDLPKGLLTQPVKTTTQFEFCLDAGDGHCVEQQKYHSEARQDTIYSIGYRLKASR